MNTNSLTALNRITQAAKEIFTATQMVSDEMQEDEGMSREEMAETVAQALGVAPNGIFDLVNYYLHQLETDQIGFVRKGAGGGYVKGIRPAPKPKTTKPIQALIQELDTTTDEEITTVNDNEVEEIAV